MLIFNIFIQGAVLPAFWKLLLLKAFRPDRLLAGATQFVAAVFGDNFSNVNEVDLVKIVEVRPVRGGGAEETILILILEGK